jgi:hypothetical protein
MSVAEPRVSCRGLFRKLEILPGPCQYTYTVFHIISFIFILWIRTGLKNPYGYGSSQICLKNLEVKSI